MDPNLHVTSFSNRAKVPFSISPTDRTITMPNGKKFRVTEMIVAGKKIDVNRLKSEDIARIGCFVTDLVEGLGENKSPSYTISLSENSTVINEQEIETATKGSLDNIKTLGKELLRTRQEEKKYIFKSSLPGEAKATAIKVCALVLFILASPLIITVGLLITGGVLLSDLASSIKHAVLETNDLREAAEEMKAKEEEKKFKSLQKVHEEFSTIPNQEENAPLSPTKMPKQPINLDDPIIEILSENNLEDVGQKFIEIKTPLFNDEEFLIKNLQNKAERHMGRALFRKSSDIKDEIIKNLVKDLTVNDFKTEEALKTALFKRMPQLEKILEDSDIKLLVKEAKIASIDTRDQDQKALQELQDALKTQPSDYPAANKRVTTALRAVINSPSYQAIKENPDHLYVKYISHLSCAIWNNVQLIDDYQEFGKTVLENIDSSKILQDASLTAGEKQRKIMEEAHKKAKQEIYTDHGIPQKILYAFTHPRQALGSMNSEGGVLREIATAFGVSKYDPHGEFNNNPSLQGVTTATFDDNKQVSINNCYGGSPTIGDRYQTVISPEFEAVCQAVENKRFAQEKDPAIPDVIYYTNLQNIENRHGEGERSFAIMELNDRYPGSFFGMTLAKDSKFHLMPDEKGKTWAGSSNYGKEMLTVFENKKCYQYGNRTKTQNKRGEYKGGNGIYLPASREFWFGEKGDGPIPKIIEKANERFEKIEKDLKDENKELDSFKLKAAYQEYVYSMIQSYTEMILAKEATNGQVMAIRACKENIDRGGAENLKYAYSRLDVDPQNRSEIIVGAMESRALLVRGRVILEKRVNHTLSFIELLEPKTIQEDTIALLRTQKIGFSPDGQPKYKPALSSPPIPSS